MTTIVVELNDTGVIAVGAGAQRGSRSPGYALLEGDRILVGSAALSRARLKPRWVENRFWDRLDIEPLGRPFPRHLRNADLVHAHLAEVWSSVRASMNTRSETGVEAVWLAVPGFYSKRQLELLLGIGRACGMPIVGMADAAVAASLGALQSERMLHLDMLLQRVVLTELRQTGSLARRRVESEGSVGLARVLDLWAKLVAERFVQLTRFDPFHHGETEQELYDRLPGWIAEIDRDGAAVLALEHRDKVHSVEISAMEMQDAVRASYRAVSDLVRTAAAAGSPSTLVLTQTLSALPGLQSELEAAVGSEAVVLPPGAAGRNTLERQQMLLGSEDHEVDFLAELPTEPSAGGSAGPVESLPRSVERVAEGPDKVPTHLLHAGVAHPIDRDPLVLGVATPTGARGVQLTGPTAGISRRHCSIWRQGEEVVVEDHSTYGSFLNGRRIDGRALLAAGDRLRLGTPGIELHLIAVE